MLPVAPALIALTETFVILTRLFNVKRTLFQSILHLQLVASWQRRELTFWEKLGTGLEG